MTKRNKFREDRKEIVYKINIYSKDNKGDRLIKTVYTTEKPTLEKGYLYDEESKLWFKYDNN